LLSVSLCAALRAPLIRKWTYRNQFVWKMRMQYIKLPGDKGNLHEPIRFVKSKNYL
jgi:hypothetical protein